MKMQSLKFTKADIDEEKKSHTLDHPGDGPKFPWGTKLRIEDGMVDKFPELKSAAVGNECRLVCKATVVSTRMEQETGGKERRCVELQIEAMGITLESDYDTGFNEDE